MKTIALICIVLVSVSATEAIDFFAAVNYILLVSSQKQILEELYYKQFNCNCKMDQQ